MFLGLSTVGMFGCTYTLHPDEPTCIINCYQWSSLYYFFGWKKNKILSGIFIPKNLGFESNFDILTIPLLPDFLIISSPFEFAKRKLAHEIECIIF